MTTGETTETSKRAAWKYRRVLVSVALLLIAGVAWWRLWDGVARPSAYASFRANRRAILTYFTSGNFEQIGPAIAFSPDSRSIATGGEDDAVRVWDVASGALQATFEHSGKVEYVGFRTDGRTLFAEGHGSIPMVFADGPVLLVHPGADALLSIPTPKRNRTPLAFSPDGKTLATVRPRPKNGTSAWTARLPVIIRRLIAPYIALGPNQPNDEVVLWDVATGRPRAYLSGHQDMVTSIDFSPDGKLLAAAWDGYVKLWKIP